LTIRERYQQDATFAAVVDFIRWGIRENKYTPSEVREAAVLAAYLEECANPLPRWYHLIERALDAEELQKTRASVNKRKDG
jgi:hypothetical protein